MPSRPPRPRLATARWLVVATLLLGALPVAAPAPRPAAAQGADCPAEAEPNGTEAEAQPVEGELCLAGDLPTVDDQDLLLWTVSAADSPYPWTVSVDGPGGVVTSAKILAVAGEPGVEPVVAGAQLADVSTSPAATEPATATLLFSPGRYLIGVSRTVTEEGGDPPVTAYRLTLDRADDLPAQLDAEPNDDAGAASPLPAAFTTAGDTRDGVDTYAWTLSEEEAALGWELHLLAALGQPTTLAISTDLAGQPLAQANADPLGRVDLFDLALPPATYFLVVGPGALVPAPYLLSSATGPRPTEDLEPNDQPAAAAAIDPASPVRKGRLAGTDDVDLYRLSVDPTLAGSLFNLRLVARGAQPRELCVASAETGQDLQCKEGVGGAALADLLLPRGDYLVRVSGPADPADPYLLRLDVTSAPSGDFESEPNDTEALAAPLDATVPVHGRFDGDETDVYRFTTTGAPQLWDVSVAGAGITGIAFSRRDGTALADGEVADDATTARLTDLYLPPGDHWVRVAGRDGDYDIAMTPLGPPPPDGEHEANNLVVLAEPMLLGQTKTGRLADAADRDVFRFSLAADERVLLTLTPPEDAAVAVAVDWGYSRAGAGTSASPGEAIALDMTLHAGDYVVSLTSFKVSDGRYRLDLARGDRFRTRTDQPLTLGDQEPNNDAASAQPLPPGAVVDGEVTEGDLRDVFAVPPAAGRELTFVVDAPDGAYPSLNDGGANYYTLTQPGEDLTVWTVDGTVPDDVPLFLEITGAGPYTLTYGAPTPASPEATVATVAPDGGGDAPDQSSGLDLPGIFVDDPPPADGPADEPLPDEAADEPLPDEAADEPLPDEAADDPLAATPAASPAAASPVPASPAAAEQPTAPLTLSLVLETTEVAAYWSQGQSLSGALTIANPTAGDLEFDLESATTHWLVAVALTDPPTTIAAGATVEVPLTVTVQPDAWADIPVRITVAAYVGDDPAAASVDLTPTADALPVHPFQAWPLPDALLGGFDLASPALGAVVAGTVDPAQEALLHDGVAPIGSGLLVTAPTLPLALTVDLAGDAPAPVAGITVNPQATDGVPQHQVRTFELLLSTDGAAFDSALTGELPPLAGERAFVLPKPVEATSAQLLILTTYDDAPAAPGAVSLGEWTVVATPGFVPPAAAELDIGSAALGGHVVRWSPQPADPAAGVALLSPDEPGFPVQGLSQIDDPAVSWVVGFQDDRAARIVELRWVDSPDSVETNRLDEVRVEVTTGSPSGPWTPVGDWGLGRSGDGAVAPLLLDEPTWARFVRLSGTLGADAVAIEFPAQLSVVEAPVDDDYRSVAAVWGATSPAASYEVAFPPADAPGPELVDAPGVPADAADLTLGDAVAGYAQMGTDVDWYRVTAGDDDNTLTLTLTGSPTVDVVARVYDEAGAPVDAVRRVVGDASTVTYTAPADPGASYTVAVQQPPHSIVFTFDTSASLANYQPFVQQSLRSFAAGVRRGREFVQLVPFDEEPLTEDWTDDTYAVVSAINGYHDQNLSSSVETGVLDSTNLLAGREGATAILVITDAETGSYADGDEMWAALDVTRPLVFSVHVGGPATPILNEQLLEDLSSAGGSYQYTSNQAEMDRAFDRAATWLRRPTPYGLTAAASFEEATPTPEPTAEPTATSTPRPATPEPALDPTETPTVEPTPTPSPTEEPDEPREPGSIAVRADPDGDAAAEVSDAVTVEIILDTSGSMLAPLPDGQLRIDVARDVLADLVTDELPPGVPVALRVFGDTPDSCDTSLLVPPAPLDPDAMAATIAAIEPVNLVKTPLGASLAAVAEDLADVDGPKVVVLVTDGEETCGGDPAESIRALADQGVDVQVNIVGFALDDDALRAQFSEWAELGNGAYFDATSADELDDAVAQAVQAPFQVLDADGAVVATGTVGGDPVDVPAGVYDVLVLTDPERRFEEVIVDPDEDVDLDLDDADD